MGKATVIYARISQDRDGTELGVERQRLACEKRAEELGWNVVDHLVDNDISGSGKKRRPAYEELLEGLHAKRYDSVLTYAVDRLTRSPRELEDLIDAIEKARADVSVVMAGHIDLASPLGRAAARIFGAMAKAETEVKAQRQKDKSAEIARAGKPNGGGLRPYGFEWDKVTIRKDEAKVIRTVVDRLVDDGVPIGRTLRELGYPTREDHGVATRVRSTRLAAYFKNPRIIGMRMHNGELHRAVWQPILTLDAWNKLQRFYGGQLAKSTDGRSVWVSTPAKGKKASTWRHLLTGLVWCSKCSGPMRHDVGKRYVCINQHCQAIDAGFLERRIAEQALSIREWMLSTTASGLVLEDPEAALTVVKEAEAALNRLLDLYVDGKIDQGTFDERHRPLLDALAKAELELSRTDTMRLSVPVGGSRPTLDAWWETASMEERRRVISSVIHRVIVHPDAVARAGLKAAMDPGRVDPFLDKLRAMKAGAGLGDIPERPKRTWADLPNKREAVRDARIRVDTVAHVAWNERHAGDRRTGSPEK